MHADLSKSIFFSFSFRSAMFSFKGIFYLSHGDSRWISSHLWIQFEFAAKETVSNSPNLIFFSTFDYKLSLYHSFFDVIIFIAQFGFARFVKSIAILSILLKPLDLIYFQFSSIWIFFCSMQSSQRNVSNFVLIEAHFAYNRPTKCAQCIR